MKEFAVATHVVTGMTVSFREKRRPIGYGKQGGRSAWDISYSALNLDTSQCGFALPNILIINAVLLSSIRKWLAQAVSLMVGAKGRARL